MPRKIIIDTDPGVDDAMAILFALRCPELEVMGLTTVFGNVGVDLATQNALRILELDGNPDIPVARGAESPMQYPDFVAADFVHGEDGLGNTFLAKPQGSSHAKSAAEFIVDSVMSNPGEVTLLGIGPLTNLALALKAQPEIATKVVEVVVMGGAATVNGNINPAAESNIYKDPHAADIVFTAGWKLTMIGLDVTMKILMSEAYLASLSESEAGKFIFAISRVYQAFHARAYGIEALHTHDPAAVAFLINPELFNFERGSVRVPSEGLARGQTIWNRREDWLLPNEWSEQPPVNIATDVDAEGLLNLFREKFLN